MKTDTRPDHALADGISGAALLNVILDPTPEASLAITKRRYRVARNQSKTQSCLADLSPNAMRGTLESMLAAEAGLVSLLPELAASVGRLPFNRPCTGEPRFWRAEFRFADVQAIRAAAGTSANDVILAVLARAVAGYPHLHGQGVEHRFIRVGLPIQTCAGTSLGNQI